MSTEELPREDDPTATYPTLPDTMPTVPIATAVSSGDRCNNCHAPLAPDQRYCVNCGERRGRARFSAATLDGPGPTAGAADAQAAPEPRGPRFGSSATLVAFVATLLVAVGLGVLIGHDSANTAPRTTPVASQPNIIVNGGGSAGTGASSSGTSATSGTSSHSKTPKASKAAAKTSAKVVAKASSAAGKVLGGGASKLAPSTVKQGGACTSGAGCQGGKFTGNFFGQ